MLRSSLSHPLLPLAPVFLIVISQWVALDQWYKSWVQKYESVLDGDEHTLVRLKEILRESFYGRRSIAVYQNLVNDGLHQCAKIVLSINPNGSPDKKVEALRSSFGG